VGRVGESVQEGSWKGHGVCPSKRTLFKESFSCCQ